MTNLVMGKLTFYPIDGTAQNVALGGAGYVDTDCSAIVGTDTEKIWLVIASTANASAQLMAARAHGATTDSKVSVAVVSIMTKADNTGHIDLYRNATTNVAYVFTGYFR